MFIAETLYNKPDWQVEYTAKANRFTDSTVIYTFSDGSAIEQNKVSGLRQVFLPNGWNVTRECVKRRNACN